MKNENDKVKAFALKVIEKLTDKAKSCQTKIQLKLYDGLCESVKIVQSLIPKEEIIEPSTKTESEETKTYEVPLIERKIGDFVKDFLESNFGYDLSNETEDQRKYRIETIYSTVKAMKKNETESEEVKAGEKCEGRDHSGWYKEGLTYLGVKNSKGMYICEFDKDGINAWNVGVWLELRKPQPTPEQKARKKAEEICLEGRWNEDVISVITEALLIDPKTL